MSDDTKLTHKTVFERSGMGWGKVDYAKMKMEQRLLAQGTRKLHEYQRQMMHEKAKTFFVPPGTGGSEFGRITELDHGYKCADPKRDFTIRIFHIGNHNTKVLVDMEVVMVGSMPEDQEVSRIHVQETIPEALPADHAWLRKTVRNLLHKLVTHEIDEWLRADGKHVQHPHPELVGKDKS